MIGRVLRMNAADNQVTLTWIPEGKRGEGRGGGGEGGGVKEGCKESWGFD